MNECTGDPTAPTYTERVRCEATARAERAFSSQLQSQKKEIERLQAIVDEANQPIGDSAQDETMLALGLGGADANQQRRAARYINRLEAVVSRLPVTADGVPVVPEMELWYYCPYKHEINKVALRTDYSYMPSGRGCQLNIQHVGPSRCYSTREAAGNACEAAISKAETEAAEAAKEKTS